MSGTTITEIIRSALGVPAYAIPLSLCHIQKPYLLSRAGISEGGCAILFAIPYTMAADRQDPERNISLYAVPRDYHGYAKELSDRLLPLLQESFPHNTFALFADHSPIAEAETAAIAGLGVLGENGLLITPDYGSFVFLAEVVTDADYMTATGDQAGAFPHTPPACEGCGACAAACPGGCIARKDRDGCLSTITQKKGMLTAEEVDAIRRGGLAWGCDVCQTVCPHNKQIPDTLLPYFREARISHLTVEALDAMTEDEFSSRAYSWRGRDTVRRNLLILGDKERSKS